MRNRKSPGVTEAPVTKNETKRLSIPEARQSREISEKRGSSSSILEKISEAASRARYSNDSSASTSTLLIQNLLCEMDSGLSGTQINDRLLECVGKIKSEKKGSKSDGTGNMETPKSSKAGGRVSTSRMPGRGKQDSTGRNVLAGPARNSKSPLEAKKNASKTCFEVPSGEFKENLPKAARGHLAADKNVLSLKNELVKGDRKGFDSSTPKAENPRPNAERFKYACSKLFMNEEDWEPPRISSVRKPVAFTDTDEELENTLSPDGGRFERTVVDKDSYVTENSRDLTLVLERISGMKEDAICKEKSANGGRDIFAVVKKLENYPKGRKEDG